MSQPSRQPLTPASADPRHGTLRRLKSLSTLLDNAVTIPGINYRVGLDPLLGLIPGAGDLAGVAFSTYIVLQAARWRLPKETIGRMVFNILCEAVVGTVPVVGDIFDVAWKANAKNVALLEAHIAQPQTRPRSDRWVVALLIGGFLVIMVALLAVSLVSLYWLIQWLLGAIAA